MKNIQFEYKNHKGNLKTYVVFPIKIEFGTTLHITEPEWLLKAVDAKEYKNHCFIQIFNA